MAMQINKLLIVGAALVALLVLVAAATYLLLRTPEPGALGLDPDPVLQGGQVRVSGQGFLPAEPVTIRVAQQTGGSGAVTVGGTEASLQGRVDGAYIALPESLASGVHAVQVVGQISGRQATAVLYVRSSAPWITLGSSEAKPRGKLGLVAGGFAPGERLRVTLDARKNAAPGAPTTQKGPSRSFALATLRTDLVGNTVWSQVKLPLVSPGRYAVVVRGLSSGQDLSESLDVTAYQPSVELSPWAGPPGTKVQLNARGFEPGETVRVYVGSTSVPAAAVTADQYGNLWGAGPVRIPYGPPALPVAMKLVGTDSTAQTAAQFRVLTPKPWLELTQYWGAPGGSVEFSGGGWAGGERIAFYIGSTQTSPVAFGRADDYGWLHNAGPATIPTDALTQVTFLAVGEDSHSVATATFKIVLPFGIRPSGAPAVPSAQATP